MMKLRMAVYIGFTLIAFVIVLFQIPQTVHSQPARPTRNPPAAGGGQGSLAATLTALPAPQVPQSTLIFDPSNGSSSIQATFNAVATQISGLGGNLEATLQAFEMPVPVVLEGDTASFTSSITLSESQINTLLTSVLAASGYGGASVDLIPGGAVTTIPNITLNSQISGTLVFTVNIAVVDGVISLTIISASINGVTIPTSLLDDIVETVEGTLVSTIESALAAASSAQSLTYTVDSIVITDTDFTTVVTVGVSGIPTVAVPTRRP